MPRTAINVNGVDVCETYSMVVTEAPGLWDGFALQDQAVQIPRRIGAIVTDPDPVVPAREFTVRMVMRATTMATRIANEVALNQLCFGSLCEFVRVDATTLARYGRVQRLAIAPTGPEFIATSSKIEMVVKCFDPLAYELNPSNYAFLTTRTAIPGGNTAFSPRTVISNTTAGDLTNFTIIHRGPNGTAIATMVLTGTLATGEMLDVDHGAQQIAKISATNVRTSARSWLTSGTYFVMRNGDTLEVDKGVGLATYWKSYY